VAIAGLALAVALSVPSLVEQRQPMSKEATDWHSVAALIESERADGGTTAFIFDRVRHHPRATARVISYAYPDAFADGIDVTLRTSAAESGRLWETTTPLAESLSRLDGADEVYLLTSTASDGTADTTSTLRPEGWVVDGTWILSDVKIVRYSKEHA
jgi:mannosyltransferase